MIEPAFLVDGQLRDALSFVWAKLPSYARRYLNTIKPTVTIADVENSEFIGRLEGNRVTYEIHIQRGLRPVEKTISLAHEISHVVLHHGLVDVLMSDALSPQEFLAMKKMEEDAADFYVCCVLGLADEFERVLERSDRRGFLQPRWWLPEAKRNAILKLELD